MVKVRIAFLSSLLLVFSSPSFAQTSEADRLKATCTCPYFADTGEACKHIWASILVADRARVFTLPVELYTPDREREFDEAEAELAAVLARKPRVHSPRTTKR